MERYVRPESVAEEFEVSLSTVYRWISEGKLPARRLGGTTIRVPERAVYDLMEPVRPDDPDVLTLAAGGRLSGEDRDVSLEWVLRELSDFIRPAERAILAVNHLSGDAWTTEPGIDYFSKQVAWYEAGGLPQANVKRSITRVVIWRRAYLDQQESCRALLWLHEIRGLELLAIEPSEAIQAAGREFVFTDENRLYLMRWRVNGGRHFSRVIANDGDPIPDDRFGFGDYLKLFEQLRGKAEPAISWAGKGYHDWSKAVATDLRYQLLKEDIRRRVHEEIERLRTTQADEKETTP